jgi:cell division protein FtsW
MINRRYRDLLSSIDMCDKGLITSVVLLCVLGAVMVYNAGSFHRTASSDTYYLFSHLARLALGIAVLFGVASMNYKILNQRIPGYLLLVVGTLLVIATVVLSKTGLVTTRAGCSRWINTSFLPIQPVEIVKIGLVIFLSQQLSSGLVTVIKNRRKFIFILTLIITTIIALILQPNYGNAMVMLLVTVVMFYISGMAGKYVGFVMGLLVPISVAGFYLVPKIGSRITSWFNGLTGDVASYQVQQSLIGIGSGGITGIGVGDSHQRLAFLPEPHTDFIFAVIGEEFGLVGCLITLSLFVLLVWRGFLIAVRAGDKFGFLVASGLTSVIAIYAISNLSMVIGLIPVMGLPLPFISYGGSALITNMAAIGILFSIDLQTKRYRINKRTVI